MVAMSTFEPVERLTEQGLLLTVDDPLAEIAQQQRSLKALQSRSSSSDIGVSYLAIYDSMMRYAEIAMLKGGKKFGDTPHLALRTLCTLLMPDVPIASVIEARHRMKKGGIRPTDLEYFNLLRARDAMKAFSERAEN